MADDKTTTAKPGGKRVSAAGRQDGDYEVELTGAKGGPIPPHRPFDEPTTGEKAASRE